MGIDYDTRVQMPLDLPEEDMFLMMKMAHEKDMTLNKFVEDLLRQYIRMNDGNGTGKIQKE
jgi:hypothetical protein